MAGKSDRRLGALVRFSVAITILVVLGHTWLGFEQSWLQPVIGLITAYGTELAFETATAWAQRRPMRFLGAPGRVVQFLLPAHITGLAVSMLLYANERLWVMAFAVAAAIASKYLLRVQVAKLPNGQWRTMHFLNPSNLGISVTLILFPWVGIAQPYQFTENISGAMDWMLPMVIICIGSILNTRFTGRMPLILAWLGGFAAQAVIRAIINGTPLVAGLVPMTGFAFILFTFYMVTDPATTPGRPRDQVIFGVAVAIGYALIMQAHIVFGLFFALTAVTALRGGCLWMSYFAQTARGQLTVPSFLVPADRAGGRDR